MSASTAISAFNLLFLHFNLRFQDYIEHYGVLTTGKNNTIQLVGDCIWWITIMLFCLLGKHCDDATPANVYIYNFVFKTKCACLLSLISSFQAITPA
jgi:hypothetical protein